MNGSEPKSNTKFIVSCVAFLSACCIGAGTWLIFKGYQTGELLIQTAASGVGGLLGVLGIGKMAAQQPQDITVTGNPPTAKISPPGTQQLTKENNG